MLSRRQPIATEPTEAGAAGPSRPTMRDLHPRYAALADRWAELQQREQHLIDEIRPLRDEIRKLGGYALVMPGPKAPEPETDHKPGVARLIGDVVKFRPKEQPPADRIAELKRRSADLSAELDEVRQAKAILQPEYRTASFEASAAVIDAIRPEYAEIAGEVSDALVALGLAWTRHQTFVRELAAAGVSLSTLKRLAILGSEEDGDVLGQIGQALRWAAEIGVFDAAKVPPEWTYR